MRHSRLRSCLVLALVAACCVFGCKESGVSPADRLTMIDGSCEGGRPLGDLGDYRIRLRARQDSLGFIRIRREAIWTSEDLSNVLGTVPCGTILWGHGPLKNAEYSMGVGYAVAVRDSAGRQCCGYVSYTVVDVVAE